MHLVARCPAERLLMPQDAGLLRRELVLGQHALRSQVPKLLELGDAIGGWSGCRGRLRWRRPGLLRILLLGILLLVLAGPAVVLAPADPVGDGGRRAGDSGRPRDTTK
jgi:hypothetical protein